MRYFCFLISLLGPLLSSFGQDKSNNLQFLVGTYTGKTSQGIYQVQLDPETLESQVTAISKGLINPSFLSITVNKKKVYTVQETDKKGGVFSIDMVNGKISEKYNQQLLAEGDHPCHISLSPNQKNLAVGNYSGGNFAVFKLNKNGEIIPKPIVIQHKGNSIDKNRQNEAHVHSCYWHKNGTDLWVIDLGMDQLKRYSFANNSIRLLQSIKFEPGAGPRQLASHPNNRWHYVINELNGTVSLLEQKNKAWKITQNFKGYEGAEDELKSAADIHVSPNGKYLYASFRANRNHVAVFEINSQTGFLTLLETIFVEGKTPRNFAISPKGNILLIANQDSENISIFKINENTGKLEFTGKKIEISMPVCIKFL